MRYKGRWIGSAVMAASSFAWLIIGQLFEGRPAWMLSFIAVNGLVGFLLGICFDRVKDASFRDDLTQAYNRRFVYDLTPGLFTRTIRRKGYLTVTIIDCDDFKKINDQNGHDVGDVVLQNMSRLLKRITRNGDYVVRWGGDEFLIIADSPDTSCMPAIASRLERQLKELSTEMNMTLSVSVGTAVFPLDGLKIDELIRTADHRMYEHKHAKKEAAAFASLPTC